MCADHILINPISLTQSSLLTAWQIPLNCDGQVKKGDIQRRYVGVCYISGHFYCVTLCVLFRVEGFDSIQGFSVSSWKGKQLLRITSTLGSMRLSQGIATVQLLNRKPWYEIVTILWRNLNIRDFVRMQSIAVKSVFFPSTFWKLHSFFLLEHFQTVIFSSHSWQIACGMSMSFLPFLLIQCECCAQRKGYKVIRVEENKDFFKIHKIE